jgi:ABC-type transporter Mla subunit MlaD
MIEVSNMSSPLQLLRDKRSSAVIDARTVEAQLARLTESAEAAGIKTNLRSVAKLFHDYIATLDESIQQVN